MIEKKNIIMGCLCAICCETLFGLSYLFTKQATGIASEFALLGWRFFVALIVMSAGLLLGFIKINLKNKSIKPLLTVALFSPCLYFIGETVGISRTTSSESGGFLACIPVASVITSSVILKKRPAKLQILGVLITLAGIEITYIMLAVGATVFILFAIFEAVLNHNFENLLTLPFVNMDFLIVILYQGIGCSVIAFFLSNIAISKIGVNRTASFIGISTVVSIVAGALILKENFSVYQLIGTIVIIMVVYVANANIKAQ